jgi:hypothetical protein
MRDRRLLARAFLAKAVYNLPTTDLLIEMLRLQPRSAPKPKAEPPPRKKRGRPKRGEVREPEITRLQRQLGQSAQVAIAELPHACQKGTKTDSKGHWHFWVGWKAHIDWVDGGLPVNVVTTSAAIHDSQVAILVCTP